MEGPTSPRLEAAFLGGHRPVLLLIFSRGWWGPDGHPLRAAADLVADVEAHDPAKWFPFKGIPRLPWRASTCQGRE